MAKSQRRVADDKAGSKVTVNQGTFMKVFRDGDLRKDRGYFWGQPPMLAAAVISVACIKT